MERKNNNVQNIICAILYLFSSALFIFAGICYFLAKAIAVEWIGVCFIIIGICCIFFSFIYFKKILRKNEENSNN